MTNPIQKTIANIQMAYDMQTIRNPRLTPDRLSTTFQDGVLLGFADALRHLNAMIDSQEPQADKMALWALRQDKHAIEKRLSKTLSPWTERFLKGQLSALQQAIDQLTQHMENPNG